MKICVCGFPFGNGKPERMSVGKSQKITVSLFKEGTEKSKRFPHTHRTLKEYGWSLVAMTSHFSELEFQLVM